MIGTDVAADQMADQVPCGIRQSIEAIERGNGKTLDLAPHSPLPKAAGAIDAKAFGRFVPEAEVEFDGQRHFRIVIVAAGTPAGPSDQRREMIDRGLCLAAE